MDAIPIRGEEEEEEKSSSKQRTLHRDAGNERVGLPAVHTTSIKRTDRPNHYYRLSRHSTPHSIPLIKERIIRERDLGPGSLMFICEAGCALH